MASPQSVASFQSVPPRPNPPSSLNRPLTEDELAASRAFAAANVPAPVTASATGGRIVDGIPIAKESLPAGGLKAVPDGGSTDVAPNLSRIADTLQGRHDATTAAAGTDTEPDAIDGRSIAQLRMAAGGLGVSTKGTKAELAARIREAARG